jgi:23S rRNA pseudouridine2605 synthase
MKRKPTPVSRHIGLARTLSKLGLCSRSQAASWIRAERVAVNGKTRRDPEFPVRGGDRLTVDGREPGAASLIYLAMNKPRGLLATAADEKGRATVYSILDSDPPWVAPIGRLDRASEGLLIFTNDSEWAARTIAPESHVPKTYHVHFSPVATDGLMSQLATGRFVTEARCSAPSMHLYCELEARTPG